MGVERAHAVSERRSRRLRRPQPRGWVITAVRQKERIQEMKSRRGHHNGTSATSGAAHEKAPPFERVWALVVRIPAGRVATYGQLSRMIDRRLTPVGVGWAIRAAGEGRIPWHRVVNARGGISTDGAHDGLQRAMLESEGVVFGPDGTLDLERYGWDPETM